LATNLVAHIMMTGYPSDGSFTGTALYAVAGGTAAVPLFVTSVTPPVSHGADQALARRKRVSSRFSSWTNRASASLRYSTFVRTVLT
jgi:hypothetical protein